MKNHLFNLVHKNKLVYNQCWEDPRCDKALLNIDTNSEILMITSAGCNALDYLLDDPKKIHCVDINPRQNALLQLKLKMIENNHYDVFNSFFMKGQYIHAERYYWTEIRSKLPYYASEYWDSHIQYFNGKGIRKSFYFRGATGILAWVLKHILGHQSSIKSALQELWKSQSLEEQNNIWNHIKPKLLSILSHNLFQSQAVLSLAGVPTEQYHVVVKNENKSIWHYLESMLDHVFTQIDIKDNYFWHVYLFGHYTETCSPNYLKPEFQPTLINNTYKINTFNNHLNGFLEKSQSTYSHFVLLDHQDWLLKYDREALNREWKLILDHSQPGTKILMRSAASNIDFIPEFAKEKMNIDPYFIHQIQRKDRVGTYASTLLATIN